MIGVSTRESERVLDEMIVSYELSYCHVVVARGERREEKFVRGKVRGCTKVRRYTEVLKSNRAISEVWCQTQGKKAGDCSDSREKFLHRLTVLRLGILRVRRPKVRIRVFRLQPKKSEGKASMSGKQAIEASMI